jgi:Protein of unknown function (DUF4058)
MKSPFPGMDPFIEGCGLWGDFHDALIQEIKNALGEHLPERYLVRTGERGYVVFTTDEGEKARTFIPDVNVTTDAEQDRQSDGKEAVALAEPRTEEESYSMRAFIEDEFRETFVEILDADKEGRLVTCIEVLSPSNKKPNSVGWELYQRKRQALLQGTAASLVEIDLLRGGEHMPMADSWRASPYRLLVSRKSLVPICRVWPADFKKPVPPIPVPLLKPDPDVPLDLQPMIEAIYGRSRYRRSIDYGRPIAPPLGVADIAWLDQQIRDRV